MKREPVLHAVLMKLAEARIDFQGLFHDLEAVVEGDV